MKNSPSSFPAVPCVLVGAALGGLCLWSRLRAAPQVPVAVIAGLDASQSVRNSQTGQNSLLGLSRASLARLGAALNPQTDRLIAVRVDRQVNEFYDASPQGYERFLSLLIRHTNAAPRIPGTRPAEFWNLAARRAADKDNAPGRKVAVAFYSDADNDDLSPASRDKIARAGRALAQNPRVLGVWIYGAKPENWEELRQLFAPLGGRLHLSPREALAPQALLDEVDAARRAASSP